MFYEVRILNSSMKLKRVIDSEELNQKFWKDFENDNKNKMFGSLGERRVPWKIKKQLKAIFPELYDYSLPFRKQ